ncbi:EamA family transporter [Vibrio ostreicida]|uniref:EamA family transporter n=1 Tax=Vibrio ostreicida TaxID=526588 RepID=A0ABT8BW70_9VIBR|nr:EamA family transporter [Vibrio ostreicida]MDN3611426.1 EamA family transporter [Vibrio ostreicida]NPD08933.1 EamA family transporter [Vibrio ostreicida]
MALFIHVLGSVVWVVLSILSALFLTLKDVSLKHSPSKLSTIQSTAIMLLMLSPICLVIIITGDRVRYDIELFTMIALSASIDAIAMVCYLKALRNGPLTKVTPLLCLVPVFQIVLTFILYNQVPSYIGSVAIIVSIASVFYGEGMRLKNIIHNKAMLSMLGVAILWASSSIIHKHGAQQVGSVVWTAHIVLIMCVFYSPFLIKMRSSLLTKNFSFFIIPALAHLLTLLTFYQAASMGNIAFVSSLRRLSTVFSVFIGWYKYHETLTNRVGISILGLLASALTIAIFG